MSKFWQEQDDSVNTALDRFTINDMIRNVKLQMLEGEDYAFSRCGDTLVVGFRDECNMIEVSVTKLVRSYVHFNDEEFV